MSSMPVVESVRPVEVKVVRTRVVSIDALRGFDMLWILGGDLFMTALGRMGTNPVARTLGEQLEHVPGPAFIFMT